MKVYVLEEMDCGELYGATAVFSTLELAKESVRPKREVWEFDERDHSWSLEKGPWTFYIYEHEVDGTVQGTNRS